MNILTELKRRNVFRVGIAYVLLGWVVMQAADFALDLVDAPNWIIQVFFIAGLAGLPIALFFAWAFEMTPEGIKREQDVDRSSSLTPQTGRKLDRAIIVFLALALVLVLGERFFLASGEKTAPTRSTPVSGPTADYPAKSIAVLPFDDLSQSRDQDWFADGLAEEILNALAKAPDLKVTSRTASFRYRDSDLPLGQIAKQLGVAHVLEGSVRASGDRIRVTAQLIRAEDGFHLWSENYDRDPADMIAIQEDLAVSIAEALETSMDPAALEAMARAGTGSVEAYRSYLRANTLLFSATTRPFGEIILEAKVEYDKAVELDPGFADAWWRLATLWQADLTPTYIWTGNLGEPVEVAMEQFERTINQAIENAASGSDQKAYQASKAQMQGRWRDAIRLYGEYVASRPNDFTAWDSLLTLAERVGDKASIRLALDHLKAEGKTDLNPAIAYLAYSYEYDDPSAVADYGLERMEQWPEVPGLWYQVHRALMWAGRAEEGAALVRRFDDDWINLNLVLARQACIEGRTADAEAIFMQTDMDANETTSRWLMLKMLGRDADASEAVRPITESVSDFQAGAPLQYGIFDPTPHPRVLEILEREGILRPPPRKLPYQCPPPRKTSVAVLAFENMSPDPANEYFADGISEEILNVLTGLGELRVIARTSAFSFKGTGATVAEIAEKLDVSYVLEGSVRKAGNRVRVTAQLIETGTESHLWSETYDRDLDDIFAVQDEIARAISNELHLQLGDDQSGALVTAPTDNLEAYNQYLIGRQLWHQRTGQNLRASAAALQSAVQMDPGFAQAWAALADALVLIPEYDLQRDVASIPAARDAVNRALELEPDLPQALTTRAYLRFMHDYDWDNAEKDFQQAMALDPSYPTAQQWYGEYLAIRYRDAEGALEQVRKGAALDPLAPVMWHVAGLIMQNFSRHEEAMGYYQRALEINPNAQFTYANLAGLFAETGEFDRARDTLDRFLTISGIELWEGPTFIDALEDPTIRPAYLEFLKTTNFMSSGAVDKALEFMLLGAPELALEALEESLEQGDPYATHANTIDIYDPLRDDPRFQAHLAKMNLWPPVCRREGKEYDCTVETRP